MERVRKLEAKESSKKKRDSKTRPNRKKVSSMLLERWVLAKSLTTILALAREQGQDD